MARMSAAYVAKHRALVARRAQLGGDPRLHPARAVGPGLFIRGVPWEDLSPEEQQREQEAAEREWQRRLHREELAGQESMEIGG
jgi:hypothetical protein